MDDTAMKSTSIKNQKPVWLEVSPARMGRCIKSFLRRNDTHKQNLDLAKEYYQKNMISKPCQGCNGHRLNQEALAVKINKVNISEFGNLSIRAAKEFIKNLKVRRLPKKGCSRLVKRNFGTTIVFR